MIPVDIEIALVGVTAMLEPATLLSAVLALVISQRPLRTGGWFYLGGLSVTLLIGVLGAFLLGNAAASRTSEPKTWVSIVTVVAGALVLIYAVRTFLRRKDRQQITDLTERMNKVAAASALTIVTSGAVLANPGVFMLIAAKSISQLDPSTARYLADWALFAVVALLPLGIALLMLLLAPGVTKPLLASARRVVERHGLTIIAIVLLGLALSLLRDGIVGLAR